MVFLLLLPSVLHFAAISVAQSCQNDGFQNGTTCACPPGFGGEIACSQRAEATSSKAFIVNLCLCRLVYFSKHHGIWMYLREWLDGHKVQRLPGLERMPDWVRSFGKYINWNAWPRRYAEQHLGLQYQAPGVCRKSYELSSYCMFLSIQQKQDILTCELESHRSTKDTTFNILCTLQPSLTPIPNTTAFGSAGSMFALLWYDGVEQFYCQANTCLQKIDDGTGTAIWDCQNLVQHSCTATTCFGADFPSLLFYSGGPDIRRMQHHPPSHLHLRGPLTGLCISHRGTVCKALR